MEKDIDSLIRKKLNIINLDDISIARDYEINKKNTKIVNDLVNNFIEPTENKHDIELEKELKSKGLVLLDDLFTTEEIDSIYQSIIESPGYNYHIAATAFNKETRKIEDSGDWNILSHDPNILLKSDILLKKMTDKKILSLIQSYLGCFPTMFSINCLWSIYTGENFKTQNTHRDYDDFKFLSLFVLLTDIDDDNGPHVYFPGTHLGTDAELDPIIVKGKKGTSFLADVYGLHNGMPLKSGKRCLLWIRYGLFLNNMHYYIKNNSYKQEFDNLFSKIENDKYNRYLLRGYYNSVTNK